MPILDQSLFKYKFNFLPILFFYDVFDYEIIRKFQQIILFLNFKWNTRSTEK